MVLETSVQLVLAAFHKKPKMCIHAICESTNMDRTALRYVMTELVKRGYVKRLPTRISGEHVYQLNMAQIVSESAEPAMIPVKGFQLLGGDETTARNRLSMLRNMRSKLICDWHPILDVLIKDYEAGLKVLDEATDPKGTEDGKFNHVWGKE